MTKLNSSTRLKVKRDTVYLPDPEGGVYFRNNESSFRMKGSTIYHWIETLMPMFNGEQTLGELTAGLTVPYQTRVYEIGETLCQNGFVRDISQDQPHQLKRTVLEKYSSQIEFIENFVDSGAYRFQEFRQAKVLAVGAGPMLVSLVSALIESGLPKFDFMVTESMPTKRQRIHELVENAREADAEVEVKEVPFEKEANQIFWKQAVRDYDGVLYVSQDGNVNELRTLNSVCKQERKVFVPAICFEQAGLSGPVVHPESDGCWGSAWRRLHQSAVGVEPQPNNFSSTTGSILANVLVFEFFKKAVGIAGPNQSNQIYLLNPETLEGNWLSFIAHPLVTSADTTPRLVEDIGLRMGHESNRDSPPNELLDYFSGLTSEEIGIFHSWEERDLIQLPLAQCFVQAVNPVSEGPADLLPEVICAGLTHEEAKRNAGLTGIEMYVSHLIDPNVRGINNQDHHVDSSVSEGFIGIGAGETIEEAVCRGLQNYLDEELKERNEAQPGTGTILDLQQESIEDKNCRYYLKALNTLNGPVIIELRDDILGFPVIRVRSNGESFTKAGLTLTYALQNALQQALLVAQNQAHSVVGQKKEPADFRGKKAIKLNIPSCNGLNQLELLQSSIGVLKENRKRLVVYDLSFEPFLKEELAGVYGVQVREEGT
ncbi:putative thiazole-containing bacteriocin maturation protein [Bacillus sp. FJAT-27225]|uniref:putative thiazole-containing bacteriocin maturation protein n=1 Tax=Bacillus sp. FJAT-27225 TaxID=1743144 RepID=UPI00080C2868|nr:putative thiazole-containing bacteriocin maturation protein [Bacillus sp. FJAT-27225]OCA84074.1 putative thiazole-containing bacteriocin maturation protein [Bacillus sp. FJAT-27225]